MTEEPERIYFNCNYQFPYVSSRNGPGLREYVHIDLSRPVTVAEAAKDSEIVRLKALLGRYADYVAAEEGTDFLNRVCEGDRITEAEAAEITSYCAALSHEGGEPSGDRCPTCDLPHPSSNPYCFCKPGE